MIIENIEIIGVSFGLGIMIGYALSLPHKSNRQHCPTIMEEVKRCREHIAEQKLLFAQNISKLYSEGQRNRAYAQHMEVQKGYILSTVPKKLRKNVIFFLNEGPF